MSAHAEATGHLPALSAHQRRMYRGGVTLVIIGETLVFVTLFSIRFLLAGMERLVEPTSAMGLVISAALIFSLVPAWLAKGRIAAGDAKGMVNYLLAVAVLAVIALIAIVYDWMTLPFAPSSPFGENYVVSTGLHAAHILIGGFWLFAAAIAGSKGAYTRDNHWVVDGGVIFWSFVVAMWIVLYVVFFML